MKKMKTWSMVLLAAVMLSVVSACGGDDSRDNGNSRTLDSFILGTWHSYHAKAYSNGRTAEFDIARCFS